MSSGGTLSCKRLFDCANLASIRLMVSRDVDDRNIGKCRVCPSNSANPHIDVAGEDHHIWLAETWIRPNRSQGILGVSR